MKVHEADLNAAGKSFALLVSRFNSLITRRLMDGALEELRRHGADEAKIEIFMVPGAFEMPVLAQKLAKSGKYDALIFLAAIIRGETPHFDYVASETAKGAASVSLSTGVPAIFGVVTADNLEQALDRAGSKSGNKGEDAARTAVEMVNLMRNTE